jgi:hypothetical protein
MPVANYLAAQEELSDLTHFLMMGRAATFFLSFFKDGYILLFFLSGYS